MERGLLWLPLLIIFFWLAWAGKQEYQKVQAYQLWSKDFERHKYDIYSILGQRADQITWGTPTRHAPTNLNTICFNEIYKIQLLLDQNLYEEIPQNLPSKPKIVCIQLNSDSKFNIPFTDLAIACNWFRYLSNQINSSQISQII